MGHRFFGKIKTGFSHMSRENTDGKTNAASKFIGDVNRSMTCESNVFHFFSMVNSILQIKLAIYRSE